MFTYTIGSDETIAVVKILELRNKGNKTNAASQRVLNVRKSFVDLARRGPRAIPSTHGAALAPALLYTELVHLQIASADDKLKNYTTV